MMMMRLYLTHSLLLGLWLGLTLPIHAQTNTVTYIYTDPQGTPLAKADAQGHIIARYDYTPYGNPVTSLGSPPNGPGYTGHVNDPETGLVYMQQRYYDPVTGRFLSVDPVTAYSNPAGAFNRYWYANDNPIKYTDPTGRKIQITNDVVTIKRLINSRAKGTFEVDKNGYLMATASKGDASRFSSTYSSELKAAIKAKETISISIGNTYKDPKTGQIKSVDRDAGGGATIGARIGGNQSVVISGNSNTTLKDSSGGKLRDEPADILAHELAGHAIPHVIGSQSGNAVTDENKIRSEVPGSGQRAPEPRHQE